VKKGAEHLETSLRIVIADDEPDTVATLAAILRDEGYFVAEASNGFEVLRLVAQNKADAVIVDIDMPGLSGYSVAREIRSVYAEATPLLICISGKWIGQTDRMLADMAGFNHFCQKPCDPQVLLRYLAPLAAVKQALHRDPEKTAPSVDGE
jgi:DNA-binding response OmpR family regulator